MQVLRDTGDVNYRLYGAENSTNTTCNLNAGIHGALELITCKSLEVNLKSVEEC